MTTKARKAADRDVGFDKYDLNFLVDQYEIMQRVYGTDSLENLGQERQEKVY